jgi:hypothetical protein
MTQEDALTILKTGVNVFLTGEPGSGKTYTLKQYINYLKEYSIDPVITASTGIAATHIGGMTIHSWSGIGARDSLTMYDIDHIATTEYIVKRISKAKVLVIDEVSMLSGSILDALDKIIKLAKGNNDPFGGLQVVFVGDFFQLPPIRKYGQEDDFAFDSHAWKNSQIVVCYLDEQHRHAESDLFYILNAARRGDLTNEHWEMLKEKSVDIKNVKNETKLFTHNKDVDIINNQKLDNLKTKKHIFEMTSKGSATMVASLIKGCLSPAKLELKIGAVVMCTKNNPSRNFVNGTLGAVIGFGSNGGYPIIQTKEGQEILVEPMSWQMEIDGKTKAEITQVPLRHAWAITVHKSQGMTINSAAIDLSKSFEYGQGYVALSRLSSLNGLELIGINNNALNVHPSVRGIDDHFKKESGRSQAFLFSAEKSEIKSLFDRFIEYCGGDKKSFVKKYKEPKQSTHDVTLSMIKSGLGIGDISRERGLKNVTIIDHIHVLVERGDIVDHEILSLVPPTLSKSLQSIYKVFDDLGSQKLTPVFEYFKGEYSYEDLRLARIVYNVVYK